ncbi:MAG: prolyl oligopeptidase family serine peptidase, partial [Planctomycetaceae bacterium]
MHVVFFKRLFRVLALLLLVQWTARPIEADDAATPDGLQLQLQLETHTLDDLQPHATVTLLSAPSELAQRPVILMLGTLKPEEPPFWSLDLLREGYLLAAFTVDHPLDPVLARRPQWLVFDQRFAHSYVQGGARAPQDAGRVMDYLVARSDVHPEKIGWMGSSSTGIPGLAVATREPRLKAIVAFVSTGAYEQWLQTWHTNGLWVGKTDELWPETRELLKWDPIRHVQGMYPCAVLMVSGGDDKVVDPATAREFVKAARPYYEQDPERLRLVVYEGFGHNLPRDVVQLYTEHWFHRYLHPTRPAPGSEEAAKTLGESA